MSGHEQHHDKLLPGDASDHTMNMHMHPMAFHFGSAEMVLFKFWDIQSPIGMIVSCFIVFMGCVLLESIRWFRVHRNRLRPDSNLTVGGMERQPIDLYLITDTLLHAVQLLISYFAMLVFMTFNVWLCATIIVAEVLTHLTFRIFFSHLDITSSISSTRPCC